MTTSALTTPDALDHHRSMKITRVSRWHTRAARFHLGKAVRLWWPPSPMLEPGHTPQNVGRVATRN